MYKIANPLVSAANFPYVIDLFLENNLWKNHPTVKVGFHFAKKKPKFSQSRYNLDAEIFGFIFVRFFFRQNVGYIRKFKI